jgi:hypothetical protein
MAGFEAGLIPKRLAVRAQEREIGRKLVLKA